MKIEIEELDLEQFSTPFWWKIEHHGGKLTFRLNNSKNIEIGLQDIIACIVHRTFGEGITIKGEANEQENN
jgi:hypothetical protein